MGSRLRGNDMNRAKNNQENLVTTAPKKRLFVCCDGTWNRPDQREFGVLAPTNVLKFRNAVVPGMGPDGVEQRVYYHPGVGASDEFFDRVFGGAFGVGLRRNIRSAYHWLCQNYVKDDEIFIVGFSRGAFTARSLGGMIAHCGLVPGASHQQVEQAFAHYQGRKLADQQNTLTQTRFQKFQAQQGQGVSAPEERPQITFLGVWDTVGSLGIPQAGTLVRRLEQWFPRLSNRFHDMSLSSTVKAARHAMAIDEQRQPFNVSLWQTAPGRHAGQTIKQVWFPGIHSDVGGGFSAHGLSDNALNWMLDEAQAEGAHFDVEMRAQINGAYRGPIHDAMTEMYNVVGARPRSLPVLLPVAGMPLAPYGQAAHESTVQRITQPPIDDAPYRQTHVLQAGEARRFPVYARNYWNAPGIFLQAGKHYRVSARGTWMDASLERGPAGDRPASIQHFYGKLRRVPQARWFALVASIGCADCPDHSNDLVHFPTYIVGAGATLVPAVDGYLYLFANDMAGMYGNNRGSVEVTVERLADDAPVVTEILPVVPRELGLWDFVWRWCLATAALALVIYLTLLLALWVLHVFDGVSAWLTDLFLRTDLSAVVLVGIHGGAYLTVFAVVALAMIGYSWFKGRSDTRVQFVPSDGVSGSVK